MVIVTLTLRLSKSVNANQNNTVEWLYNVHAIESTFRCKVYFWSSQSFCFFIKDLVHNVLFENVLLDTMDPFQSITSFKNFFYNILFILNVPWFRRQLLVLRQNFSVPFHLKKKDNKLWGLIYPLHWFPQFSHWDDSLKYNFVKPIKLYEICAK